MTVRVVGHVNQNCHRNTTGVSLCLEGKTRLTVPHEARTPRGERLYLKDVWKTRLRVASWCFGRM